jgi:hypothetical protein
MGSITNRLRALEERGRGWATDEVRRAWMRLSDEEMALILAPFHFGRPPTPEELAARTRFQEAVPETLIARAIAFTGEMSADEVGHRLQELLDPVLARRRSAVSRRLKEGARG